jgi:hypothetical protein
MVITKEDLLRERLRQIARQKLIDSLKCEDRLKQVKSAGNGL